MPRLTKIHYFCIIWLFVACFNGIFIDSEQIFIKDPNKYNPEVEIWPPKAFVDVTHWWGRNYDPCLILREQYYQFLVWIDLVYYIPMYIILIFGIIFSRGKWVQTHLIAQQVALFTGTATIFFDNYHKLTAAGRYNELLVNFSAYSSYLLVPIFLVIYLTFNDLFPNQATTTESKKKN
eukprot:TRINITY_DN9002_c0_g1_i1.p1 TRINITY_DN9002_c0_g1~~TRINITY_DN9002_c0_g1_i1.p1  ORF type:complete len:178 (-),score=16.05 TRINITY_DN9002_c0_g1_i1:63-596(-)